MIKDSKDFNEQLNILKQGIKIPQLDVSKVMNSVEFNEYLNNIQVALNDLTQSTRILQDCNEYMIKYVNNVVDKKYKEFQQKLEYIEKNYSLYQNKSFISYPVKLNYEKEVRDRDNTIIGIVDYINQQNGAIDLFKNVSAEEAYSVEIDKEKGSCIIVFNKDTITKNNKKVATFMIKLMEPVTLNYVSCDLINCNGSFTINNAIQKYNFNTYFNQIEVSIILITLETNDFTTETKEILKKQYKGFMDNAYTGTNQINKDTEKAKEQQMVEIYYKNDVTKYIGESNGGRSKN